MRRSLRLALFLALAVTAVAGAARERTGGVDVFIVLDESGSMKPIFTRVTGFIADALVQGYLEPGDYLCVVGFSDLPRVRVSQRLSGAAEKENLAEMVRRLNVVPQGYTDMGRALEETTRQLERLAAPANQQVLLILTDGLNQPPRDSPYYFPARPDAGAGLVPPSLFNPRFLQQVKSLGARGYQMHVVGIGLETDAQRLAEALGAGYTVVREFRAEELAAGLARFWDDTINLLEAAPETGPLLPGGETSLTIKLRSTSDKEREVRLRGARVARLERLGSGPEARPEAARLTPVSMSWAVPSRRESTFAVELTLAEDFPAGEYRATAAFDQESAVKFYPPEVSFTFRVPSFWERHGSLVMAAALGLLSAMGAAVFYQRRPVALALVVEGETEAGAPRPVRFKIGGIGSIGGGAADRFRIAGLPQKAAVLERRSVDRFALLSTRPELLPTVPEYRVGDPIELSGGEAGTERRVIRFIRAGRKPARTRARPSAATSRRTPTGAGGIDFR